jgi:N-acetylmuramoyl-L-alanine amidase
MDRIRITPRRLLLPLALASVAAAPGAAQAATRSAAAAPRTHAATATLHGAPVRPGVRPDFVGVQWAGPREGAAIRLRRAAGWGPWRALPAGELHRPGRNASELVRAAGATAYQVRLPAGARDARATAIDVPHAAPGARARSAATDLPPGLARICFRTRAAWHADESLRFDASGKEIWPPAYFPVQKLTFHHTATEGPATGADAIAAVQAIYRYHAVDLGFGDIGYHLLVDGDGCVYEGRHSGPDPFPVFGARSASGELEAVNAGHTLGFNAGNVGIAFIGDFTNHPPTPAALRSAVRAAAAVAGLTGLDPLGSGTYVNPITGATKDVPNLSGHRDWLATACPGDALYPLLPEIRERVARLVAGWRPEG